MNEKQKAQALTLGRLTALVEAWRDGRNFCVWVQVGQALALVPNLADTTGAVEGVLHRVLEGMVGEVVHLTPVWGDGEMAGWMAERAYARHRLHGSIHHPTRLDAIVASLLAMVAPNADVCADGARSHTTTGATT